MSDLRRLPPLNRRLRHTLLALIFSSAYSSSTTNNDKSNPGEVDPSKHLHHPHHAPFVAPTPSGVDAPDPLSALFASSFGDLPDIRLPEYLDDVKMGEEGFEDPELKGGLLGQCDTSFLSRAKWTLGAKRRLTEQGDFEVTGGTLKYAPLGTISNPDGTYGALIFDEAAAYPDADFCTCLGGNATVGEECTTESSSGATKSSQSREQACKGTYVLQPEDAVVIVGCTPPENQYFALQTNVYSRFEYAEELNHTGLFYPLVAPYDSINTASINTVGGAAGAAPYNSAFIVISTADQGTADAIADALVEAGAPREAINIDSLTNEDVKLWEGGDWRKELPDSLQMVMRINGPQHTDETNRYILGSMLGSQRALIVRANGKKEPQPMAEGIWRPRVVTDAQADIADTYAPALDAIVQSLNATAEARGLRMSYYGDLMPAMDFGYVQEPNDVEECCIGSPRNETFWLSATHYSTRDCLYEAAGGYTDYFSGADGWNGGQPGMVGTTRETNFEAIGEPGPIETFFKFECLGENQDEMYYIGQCNGECSTCAYNYTLEEINIDGCNLDPYGSRYSVEYVCVNGSAMYKVYEDAECNTLNHEDPIGGCQIQDDYTPTEELWAGGYLREDSVVVVVGAMSNKLGVSALHDIYLPVYVNYNNPDAELDFKESELEGSSAAWVPASAISSVTDDVYENVFVAQWGRSCLGTPDDAESTEFCMVLDEATAPSPLLYNIIVRHYLDVTTGTGPHKDALPRHRLLVFDKMPEAEATATEATA